MKAKKIYSDLIEIFEKLNYKIIMDKGSFNSGYCILENEKTIVINKSRPYENRNRILCEILSLMDINSYYIKPYIRDDRKLINYCFLPQYIIVYFPF